MEQDGGKDMDETFMKAAMEQAALGAAAGEVPVGAVLVRRGEILARAYNRTRTDKSPLAHAELLVIGAACEALGYERPEDCTLYVTLEPCPMCAGAILNARIGRVVFSLTEGKSGAFGSVCDLSTLPFAPPVRIERGDFGAEVQRMMRAFFAARRAGGMAGAADAPAEVPSEARAEVGADGGGTVDA